MQTNPDGTISISFDGQVVRVKAPKVGQYRRLRETIYNVDQERAEKSKAWREEAGMPDPFPDDPTVEQSAARATVLRKEAEFNEDGLLNWWHLVLVGEALGDDPFPSLALDPLPSADSAEWPMELTTTLAYQTAMAHWVAAPLRSSGSPAPT